MSAQSIEQLAKDNFTKVCDCMAQLDYIDSRLDFELKMDACITQNLGDNPLLKEEEALIKYIQLLESDLMDNCTIIHTLITKFRTGLYQEGVGSPQESPMSSIFGKKLAGQYSLTVGNSDPLGFVILTIMENGTYDIMSFGEQRVGTWKIVKEKYLHLIPAKHLYPFQLYARHNSDLGDSTKTAFLGDDFSYNTLIHYGEISSETPIFSPIFNIDANCFDFPYTAMIKGKHKQISLALNSMQETQSAIYTFNNEQNYNDFIIFESTNLIIQKSIRIIIGEDGLILGKEEIATRRPIQDENKHIDLFKNFINTPAEVYFNLGYRQFESELILSDNYEFNTEQNAYISKLSVEYPTDSDYDNILRVNKYEQLQKITFTKKEIKIGEKSIIYTVCD